MARQPQLGTVRKRAVVLNNAFLLVTWVTTAAFLAGAPTSFAAEHVSTVDEAAEQRERIAELIADLADDEIRWNASRAVAKLVTIGLPAVEALEQALVSEDYQQRQLAAAVLRRLHRGRLSDMEATQRLLQVTVEGLADDHIPGTGFGLKNARSGVEFLIPRAEEARWDLADALDSHDLQQRFFAAYVLGRAAVAIDAEKTAGILIEHLADNDILSDACLSASALYTLGKPAVPILERHQNSADKQQRQLVKLVLLDIESPPETSADLDERKKLHEATTIARDPCVETRFWGRQLAFGNHARWRRVYEVREGTIPVPCLLAFRQECKEERLGRVHFQVESVGDGYVILRVGVVKGRVFDWFFTLKIEENGVVRRRQVDRRGHETWVMERNPYASR